MTLTPGEDQHGDLSLTLGVSQQLQRKQSHIQLNLENPRGSKDFHRWRHDRAQLGGSRGRESGVTRRVCVCVHIYVSVCMIQRDVE